VANNQPVPYDKELGERLKTILIATMVDRIIGDRIDVDQNTPYWQKMKK